MNKPTNNILSVSIDFLDLSEEFKDMARAYAFKTLSQLAELPVDVLQKYPLFNLRMLSEYVSFLERNGLGGLLED